MEVIKISEEMQKLIQQFEFIAEKKWIKSVNKGLGSVGYTFEKELGKNPDSLYFPDYYGIEIKCTGRYSRYPITLFTVAFDGPTFPEINRLVEKYGYADKDYSDKKVLFERINCLEKTLIQSGYLFQFKVDDIEEKLYLCVYDMAGNLCEKNSFVYFKTLYDHLVLKLSYLAIVYASQKQIENEKYFRYYKLIIYRLKNFETFISLLKRGIIQTSLIARISKSGNDKGRYRNKNLVFMLKKDEINTLFDQVYYSDYDNKVSNLFWM